jgi:hypothetical protein
MENKTIQFNPDLFKIQSKNRKTKKKNNSKSPIKFKSNSHLLKQIRNEQQKNYKNLFENKERCKPASTTQSSEKSEFESSIDFLDKIIYNEEIQSNNTEQVKSQDSSSSSSSPQISWINDNNNSVQIYYPDEPCLNLLSDDTSSIPKSENVIGSIVASAAPIYGNLKNGKLPTFRSLRETQKNKNLITKDKNIESNLPPPPLLNSMKKKRIIRRTFRVGKDKYENKVSVLISNKTMRNKNENKAQQLKSVSMTEIYNYLIKKGLIKVGTSAPDNVLRQLYESSILTAGEIQNHNLENVLYNYITEP